MYHHENTLKKLSCDEQELVIWWRKAGGSTCGHDRSRKGRSHRNLRGVWSTGFAIRIFISTGSDGEKVINKSGTLYEAIKHVEVNDKSEEDINNGSAK